METITHVIDFVLHPDLAYLLNTYGVYIYAILFLIIFVETGLVIMPLFEKDKDTITG